MGARKRKSAEALKEQRKDKSFAVLNNLRMSPRKVRLVADQIRGIDVNQALNILRYSPKYASNHIEKLLFSAIANWQTKNEQKQLEDSELFVKEIFVNQGRSLKRIQPAPQGRAHRILKRSCHVTLVVDTMNKEVEEIGEEIIDTVVENDDTKKDNDNKKTNKK
ncbi:MAG: 50S ribosomal protein L22 [Bacteroidales bacterium]|nr:50S ribosomal protein L22 [Bacteroidales bacterium]